MNSVHTMALTERLAERLKNLYNVIPFRISSVVTDV